MNEERIGKYLRQVQHLRGHLWHRYSISINQVVLLTLRYNLEIAFFKRDEVFYILYFTKINVITGIENISFESGSFRVIL